MFHFYYNLFDIYNGKTKKAKKAKDFSYDKKKKKINKKMHYIFYFIRKMKFGSILVKFTFMDNVA